MQPSNSERPHLHAHASWLPGGGGCRLASPTQLPRALMPRVHLYAAMNRFSSLLEPASVGVPLFPGPLDIFGAVREPLPLVAHLPSTAVLSVQHDSQHGWRNDGVSCRNARQTGARG